MDRDHQRLSYVKAGYTDRVPVRDQCSYRRDSPRSPRVGWWLIKRQSSESVAVVSSSGTWVTRRSGRYRKSGPHVELATQRRGALRQCLLVKAIRRLENIAGTFRCFPTRFTLLTPRAVSWLGVAAWPIHGRYH